MTNYAAVACRSTQSFTHRDTKDDFFVLLPIAAAHTMGQGSRREVLVYCELLVHDSLKSLDMSRLPPHRVVINLHQLLRPIGVASGHPWFQTERHENTLHFPFHSIYFHVLYQSGPKFDCRTTQPVASTHPNLPISNYQTPPTPHARLKVPPPTGPIWSLS